MVEWAVPWPAAGPAADQGPVLVSLREDGDHLALSQAQVRVNLRLKAEKQRHQKSTNTVFTDSPTRNEQSKCLVTRKGDKSWKSTSW